jgi:hypothetical protein
LTFPFHFAVENTLQMCTKECITEKRSVVNLHCFQFGSGSGTMEAETINADHEDLGSGHSMPS